MSQSRLSDERYIATLRKQQARRKPEALLLLFTGVVCGLLLCYGIYTSKQLGIGNPNIAVASHTVDPQPDNVHIQESNSLAITFGFMGGAFFMGLLVATGLSFYFAFRLLAPDDKTQQLLKLWDEQHTAT